MKVSTREECKLKIKYLGTAAAEGWPALFCKCEACKKAEKLGGRNIRTRSQAVIDDELLIDFPPDTYMHMLTQGLKLNEISDVIVTHSHQDHFYPIETMLRCEPFGRKIDKKLRIYGNKESEKCYYDVYPQEDEYRLKNNLEYRYIEAFVPVTIGGYVVTPLLANHDKSERCYIYLISDGNKTILYANDTGIFPEQTWEYLKDKHINLVSLDCTTILDKDGNNHMGVEDNIIVKERLEKMGCTDNNTKYILNHFSHNGKLVYDELVEYVREYGFIVSYDGFEIEI
jgi:phosphoribosyl 1,2-cyclic phosphate phosphodiesterase